MPPSCFPSRSGSRASPRGGPKQHSESLLFLARETPSSSIVSLWDTACMLTSITIAQLVYSPPSASALGRRGSRHRPRSSRAPPRAAPQYLCFHAELCYTRGLGSIVVALALVSQIDSLVELHRCDSHPTFLCSMALIPIDVLN
jgi:hypothetical protein